MKNFEEYIAEGIVKKQQIDFKRAEFLLKESKNNYKFLKKIVAKFGIDNTNSNHIIKNAYDIIMEIIRAKMLEKGYKSSGQGAHQAEVVYLNLLGWSKYVDFLDQLRYFRNKILYEGGSFDKEYAERVLIFLEKMVNRLG